ncbi:DUF1667 domain-containing protein [Candidatus Epulonipiscium viviparus]|uniref:DUF1667 domain-containing protein n=1 Tax=Candidatus Epulonipiscium viviparus TaxID=420336 RepID=UPI00016BFF3F|nr:DUF1667 domain-containing protein [Candidatus Epulopiscium viviparus]
MNKELTCIVCPKGCGLVVNADLAVVGNSCPKGVTYGVKEVTAPTRVVTSTVKIEGGVHNRLPVKTDGDIPKELINECMKAINEVTVKAPVKMYDVIIEDLLDTGVSVVATRAMQ